MAPPGSRGDRAGRRGGGSAEAARTLDWSDSSLTDELLEERLGAELPGFLDGLRNDGCPECSINLAGNLLTGRGPLGTLLHGFREAEVRVGCLRLHRNRLRDEALAALAEHAEAAAVAGRPLAELHLSDNQLTEAGVQRLIASLFRSAKGGFSKPLWLRLENQRPPFWDPVGMLDQLAADGMRVCLLPSKEYQVPGGRPEVPVHLHHALVPKALQTWDGAVWEGRQRVAADWGRGGRWPAPAPQATPPPPRPPAPQPRAGKGSKGARGWECDAWGGWGSGGRSAGFGAQAAEQPRFGRPGQGAADFGMAGSQQTPASGSGSNGGLVVRAAESLLAKLDACRHVGVLQRSLHPAACGDAEFLRLARQGARALEAQCTMRAGVFLGSLVQDGLQEVTLACAGQAGLAAAWRQLRLVRLFALGQAGDQGDNQCASLVAAIFGELMDTPPHGENEQCWNARMSAQWALLDAVFFLGTAAAAGGALLSGTPPMSGLVTGSSSTSRSG